MRLIDADELKNQADAFTDDNGMISGYVSIEAIDNAPTITPKEFEPLIRAIIDVLPAIVEKTVPAIKALERLDAIEKIAREAFQNPDTKNIDLYRSQKLADIFAIFEYDGATIPEKKEEDDDQMTFDDFIGEETDNETDN